MESFEKPKYCVLVIVARVSGGILDMVSYIICIIYCL